MLNSNHPSAGKNSEVVDLMLQKEIEMQRIVGPFETPPFRNFVCSPLACIEKKETGKFRLIHNLSFPKCNSVNSFIDKELATVKYESFDDFVKLVQVVGTGALMAKSDIEEAFRFIPIHPDDYHLLGFTWRKQFYYDTHLPMGCRRSCAIFEAFSTAIQWICINKLGCKYMSHILDDFMFVGSRDSDLCKTSLQAFLNLSQQLNIPIKYSKTSLPANVMEAHGIEIDSALMQYRLPSDKLNKARDLLIQFSKRRKVTLKEMQSLIGFLQFACKAVAPGRTFLRHLIDLTVGVSCPHHHIRLNSASRSDINMWLQFLDSYNNKSIFLFNVWLDTESLNLFTDASGAIGFGAMLGSKWIAGLWPESWSDVSIAAKELFPIMLSVEIWGHLLANHKLIIQTDNSAVVDILNKQTSRDKFIMHLVRRFVLACLQNNILIKARHIPGKYNTVADLLSRFKLQEARQAAPQLEAFPSYIPLHLRP